MFQLTRSLATGQTSRLLRWSCVGLVTIVTIGTLVASEQLATARQQRADADAIGVASEKLRQVVLVDYDTAQRKIAEAGTLGADVTESKTELVAIRALILENNYLSAGSRLTALIATVDSLIMARESAAEAEKQKGTITGVVKEGSTALASVKVVIKNGSAELASTTSGSDGRYSVSVMAGSWTLVGSKSGYISYTKSGLSVTAQKTVSHDFGLAKAVASAPPATSGGTTNGDSSYELTTVNGYSVHLAKFNLASGQFRVRTDTAADGDCTDNCPTKSLSSYVGDNGGFAGMNGTYFCPSDYASCAGQINSFFWKVYNSRLGKMINGTNGLGEGDPFIAFDALGTARYFGSWSSYGSSGFAAVAGINCKPALISGSSNILNVSSLDDKQRSTRSNRGAIGLKGQVLYLVIAKSATVVDLASVMDSLDVDSAFNLDGGGSSAMIFNGSYKTGPGRSLPNAIIITRS